MVASPLVKFGSVCVCVLNNFGALFVKTPEPPTHQSVSFAGNLIL